MKKLALLLALFVVVSCSKSEDNSKPNLTGLVFVPINSVPYATIYGGMWKLQSISTVSNNSNIIKDCQLSTYFIIRSIRYGERGDYNLVYDNCSIQGYGDVSFSSGSDSFSMVLIRDQEQKQVLIYNSSITKDRKYLKLILIAESYYTYSTNILKSSKTYPEAERKVFIYKNDSN